MKAIQIRTGHLVDYFINIESNTVTLMMDGQSQIWLGIEDFFKHFQAV